MGIVPCFLIYPLLKKLLGTKLRIPAAALGGALSMFTGALCVVGEALLSGETAWMFPRLSSTWWAFTRRSVSARV